MRYFFLFLFILGQVVTSAQDTIRVMHYNLLNFGNTTSYCTPSNNNLTDKEAYLKTILSYIQPDILSVNEIAGNTYIIGRLMDSCLNINGITYFQHASYVNTNGSDIVSMLYYNSDKFAIHSQETVTTNIRDIILYKLYYRASDLNLGDTAFLIPIVVHLKAGSTTNDENERAAMATALMNHLNISGIAQNYLLSGDLNLKTSAEQAYQNLINHPNSNICFHDPIYQPGNWNSNSTFAAIHTQSTHTANNGCASTGGMDDRFDLIIVNNNILNGADHYQFIAGSYKAVGNDGLHYNNAINGTPANISVPAAVLDALYNMSDHLPVVLDLFVDKITTAVKSDLVNSFRLTVNNPVSENVELLIFSPESIELSVELISLQGKQLFRQTQSFSSGQHQLFLPIKYLPSGIYFFRIFNALNQMQVLKLIKI